MRVVFCASHTAPEAWIDSLRGRLPGASVVAFDPSDTTQADFAVVWAPGPELFEKQRALKAIFNLGAGIDALMATPNLPPGVPVVRLGDAGMSVQMAEYVCHAVIRHARELDLFETDMRNGSWKFRKPTIRAQFPVGIMGLGALGKRVAQAVASFEYPVLGWSRTPKTLVGVRCFSGDEGLDPFLRGVRILVCVLPLTLHTASILNRANLSKLLAGGILINVARGGHLVEQDLLALLEEGLLAGATLDVYRDEPLPADHPFWGHPKIVMTPHIAARTLRQDSLAQIAEKITAFERGEAIAGIVERARGY